MPKFDVSLVRTGYRYMSLEVEAENAEAAEKKAKMESGNIDWPSEKGADVDMESITELPSNGKSLFWVPDYRPWIMGGNVNYLLGAMLDSEGPIDVGSGYFVHVAEAPNGKWLASESRSGAVVGNETSKEEVLKAVRGDVATAKSNVMARQVARAVEQRNEVEIKEPADLFEKMRLNNKPANLPS